LSLDAPQEVRAYWLDDVGRISDLGPASHDDIAVWLDTMIAAAEAGEMTGFGLRRAGRDYMELSLWLEPEGYALVFTSLRLILPKGAKDWHEVADLIQREYSDRRQALDCAHDYLQLSREDFERKYG
jgi:hypothetical protein